MGERSVCAFCTETIGELEFICWKCYDENRLEMEGRIEALEKKLAQLLLALEHSRLRLKLVSTGAIMEAEG